MADWMRLDNMDSRDVGIRVLSYPPLCIPQRRGRSLQTAGGKNAYLYNGAWGYEDMMLPVELYIAGTASPEGAAAFLIPDEREIVFGDQPGYMLRGRCQEQQDLEKILRGRLPRRATVNFICSPFKRLTDPGEAMAITGNEVIYHPGTARSYPLIRVEGSGDGAILLRNGEEMRIYDLEPGTDLIIDSEAMLCTNEAGTEDWTARTEGAFPYLDPGDNSIAFSGGVSRLVIEPRFLWLGR